MKYLFLISSLVVISFSCKKNNSVAPEPDPAPIVVIPQISVKVNGATYTCSSCYSASQSGGLRDVSFYISSSEVIRFACSKIPTTGTYTLSKSIFSPSLMYQNNFTYFKASSGSINISSIDTSKTGVINKLVMTYSFLSDTTSGKSYTITEGSINLK